MLALPQASESVNWLHLGHAEPGCAKVKCVTLCGTMVIYQCNQCYGAERSEEPGIHIR